MTDKTEAQPETLRLADALLEQAVHHRDLAHCCDCRPEDTVNWDHYLQCRDAANELRRQHAEIERLRALAATCYAGLGGECDLPVIWLDALNDAANGEPFDTDGLLPYTSAIRAQLTTQTNRAAAAEQQVTALTQRLDMANRLNTDARNQLAQLSARQAAPDWIEDLAQSWDECMYDAPGEMIDIGASIRKAASRAAPPQPERETGKCPECGDTQCPRAQNHAWPCVPNPLRKRSHQ